MAAQHGGRALRIDPDVVVAEDGHRRRGEPAEERAHGVELAPRVGQVVAREDHQIRLEGVRLREGLADDVIGRARPDMQIRELRDPEAVVGGIESRHVERDPLRARICVTCLGVEGERAERPRRADERDALQESSPSESPLHPVVALAGVRIPPVPLRRPRE